MVLFPHILGSAMGVLRVDLNMMAQSGLVSDPIKILAIPIVSSASGRSKACLPMVQGRLR
jgi:hypothetical protein